MLKRMTVPGGERRWVPLNQAADMALTGAGAQGALPRPSAAHRSLDAIAPQPDRDVL